MTDNWLKKHLGKIIVSVIATVIAGVLIWLITNSFKMQVKNILDEVNDVKLSYSSVEKKMTQIRDSQRRQEALYTIKVNGIDFALEQIYDGEYIVLRDAKMKKLMGEYDFKTKGAGGEEK